MTQSLGVDDYNRFMNNMNDTSVVPAYPQPCGVKISDKDSMISAQKKINKKKKKKLAKAPAAESMDEHIPEPAIEEPAMMDEPIPKPVVEEAEIPPPSPTECDTPTQVYEQPELVEELSLPEEPPVDEDQQSHESRHSPPVEESCPVHDEAEGTADPVYLPFNAQHKLMVFLQQKLEEMCFAFAQRRLPELLQNRDWDCPEALELNKWMKNLHIELLFTGETLITENFQHLCDSMSRICKIVINRTRADSAQLKKLMTDAIELATLLEEERTVKIVEKLREEIIITSHSLGVETDQIQKQFNSKLKEIEVARTKLDKLENATRAALERNLLSRRNKARSSIMQSIQKARTIGQTMDSFDESVAMSSLDLVNDLENSLMLGDEGTGYATPSLRSSWFEQRQHR
ncbi:hypothetical protein FLONG3_4160 [Fusarium longipes]|uniref:Ubiquinol-cytochrome-c reductase cytochrome c1 n=1 Tax=Fusarium longipes TaxID=694270 RepID=A0A395SYY3_9HYPO|nr:hypothetical protein FLONG3_4160 [Fusarium longipes]